jgi:hypothetical protein
MGPVRIFRCNTGFQGKDAMGLVAMNKSPSAKTLRLFAGLWFPLFFALVGLRVWHRTGSLAASEVLWGATALVSLACLLFLPLARLVYLGLAAVAFPIGYVLSHVILCLVFYGVLTPIGLIMRASGADSMHRKIDRAAKSYWIARTERVPVDRYFRQY